MSVKPLFKFDGASALALLYFCLLLIWLGKNRLLGLDESWYADMAKSEVIDGHWFPLYFQGHPFWDKPPLIPWLQGLSLALGGLHEFPLRIWSALAGALSVYFIYRIGTHFAKDEKGGWLAALVLMLEPHFILSARVATLDMPLVCCFLGFWWQWIQAFDLSPLKKKSPARLLAAGLCAALGLWIKSWMGLVFLPAALLSLSLKGPRPFSRPQWLLRFWLPIGLSLFTWLSLYGLTFGKAYFDWEWGFNVAGRALDGGLHSKESLIYQLKFYAVLLEEGLPFLWPILPLGFALWLREAWRKPALALWTGPVFLIYFSIFLIFFMAPLINYLLPLVAVSACGAAFIFKARAEASVKLALVLALLLGFLNGWAGYPYIEAVLILSLLAALVPFIPWKPVLDIRWVYALLALWFLSSAYKAQDYLRHPPDPNRVWAAEVLAHPASYKGEPLLFVGEETDARALEFYSDYKIEPIGELPHTEPAQALLFAVDHRAVFLPAPANAKP